jgi:hypothetical protein
MFSSAFTGALQAMLGVLAHAAKTVSAASLIEPFYQFLSVDPEIARVLQQAREAAAMANAPAPATNTDFAADVAAFLRAHVQPCADILESTGKPVACVPNAVFQNWGRTVENTPALTCIPKTKTGVCNIVKWARRQQKTVRVAGYRHTWSDFYSNDEEVLISLLPLDVVQDLPAQGPAIDPANELQGISVDSAGRCRIGAATTNEQFRRWCLSAHGGNWNWTLPLNVIMVEITFGGSNAPICHGAGLRHPTLSDLVVEIEFVNARGELQTVSDPALLRSAAGAFGLLGIVTAITLQLEPMTYARMQPKKVALPLAIPPPSGYPVPPQIDMKDITQEQLDEALRTFTDAMANHYYAEWFWFPYQNECWINTWNNDGDRAHAVDYPDECETLFEEIQEFLGELANDFLFPHLPGSFQAWLLGSIAMAALPSAQSIVTPVIDALHFRRGIQNMRVLDLELEIPLPASASDPATPDFTVAQKAWWDAISLFYAQADEPPMRIALEMRVMGGSNVTLAPQHGNLGTCAIEVLTTPNVPPSSWAAYMQQITDKWTSCGPNVRPHWAKQWPASMYGMPTTQYLTENAFATQFPRFKADLQSIATAGGYTLDDIRGLFTNATLRTIFARVFE